MNELIVYRDNTRVVTMTATLNGAPVDLTGAQLWFTVKYKNTWKTDPDSAALFQLSTGAGTVTIQSPPTNGIATATILPSMTKALLQDAQFTYDWKVLDAVGNITTLEVGTLLVLSDVTRAGN